MSLRVFHIVFISVSILLSLFVGVWAAREYMETRAGSALLLGGFFLLMGGVLAVYGVRTYSKYRELAR
jgi:hypothetical protein